MDCLIQSADAILRMGRLQLLDTRGIQRGESALLAFVHETDSGDMVNPHSFGRLCKALDTIYAFCQSPETLAAPHARKKIFRIYSRVASEVIRNYPEGVDITARCLKTGEHEVYRLNCEKEALERAAESHNTVSAPRPVRKTVVVDKITAEGLTLSNYQLAHTASEDVKNRIIASLGEQVVMLVDPRLEPVRYWLPTIIDVIDATDEEDVK